MRQAGVINAQSWVRQIEQTDAGKVTSALQIQKLSIRHRVSGTTAGEKPQDLSGERERAVCFSVSVSVQF